MSEIEKSPDTPTEKTIQPIFHVAPSPHVYDTSVTTKGVMRDVLIGLTPLLIWSVYIFQWHALKQIAVALISCLAFETLFTKMRKMKTPIGDYSAAITGIILGMSLPATTPVYITFIGSGIAMGIGKAVFGGLGFNMFNPAMVGRAFIMLSFARWLGGPAYVSTTLGIDALSQATPLTTAKDFMKCVIDQGEPFRSLPEISTQSLFFGHVNGSIGEISALCILLGGIYLLIRKAASWQIPAGSIIGFTLLAYIFNLADLTAFNLMQHLLSGAFLFGAFFIATDPVTSPLSQKGRFYFGLGYGALVMILRVFSSYPEGVMFAILIMNGAVPLINRFTVPVPLGGTVPQKG